MKQASRPAVFFFAATWCLLCLRDGLLMVNYICAIGRMAYFKTDGWLSVILRRDFNFAVTSLVLGLGHFLAILHASRRRRSPLCRPNRWSVVLGAASAVLWMIAADVSRNFALERYGPFRLPLVLGFYFVAAYLSSFLVLRYLPPTVQSLARGSSEQPAATIEVEVGKRTSALAVICRGFIGVMAIAAPSVAFGFALVSVLGGAEPYFGMLGVTYLVVGGLAWTCVSVAHFSPRLAMVLTTFPFWVPVLVEVGALAIGRASGTPAGFWLWLGHLALAVFIAWAVTHLAKPKPMPTASGSGRTEILTPEHLPSDSK